MFPVAGQGRPLSLSGIEVDLAAFHPFANDVDAFAVYSVGELTEVAVVGPEDPHTFIVPGRSRPDDDLLPGPGLHLAGDDLVNPHSGSTDRHITREGDRFAFAADTTEVAHRCATRRQNQHQDH